MLYAFTLITNDSFDLELTTDGYEKHFQVRVKIFDAVNIYGTQSF